MAELTPVTVTLPTDKVPTKSMVKDIIATFLTKEWPSVDPETLTVSYHASYANAHCPVERPRPATGSPVEPCKVFLKFHIESGGDLEIFKDLVPTKQEEAQLCYEYGRSGLGAKVYGFFQTQDGTLGRIDEFLDARNMEPADVEDAAIRADVARGMATFHTLSTSLQRKPVNLYHEAVLDGLRKYHKLDKLKALAREGGVSIDALVDYDFGPALRRALSSLQAIDGKTAWCIHDVQFMNTMIKNGPRPGESRVVLIDFEFVMHNYRAFDLGGHFMQKLFKWFDEASKVADCRPYSDDEKRHFCDEYATRWNAHTGDADSGAQVLREAELGYLLALAFDIHNMLCFMDAQEDRDPLNLVGLNKLFDEFVQQVATLGLGDGS
ncbi:hypothetical protein HIM_05754 [Hirsutella minnesotensis 3608]|uniref:Choline kinase N-terminal domain-containing protein n=1 Tax=Hirsutella minnesotensis 3608 TaxID=1043627 RepID=A0A0F7ZP42_9HYPO|nr:hypothetical protein HIM_05754 [Hirsutella minnesotensis 3608]